MSNDLASSSLIQTQSGYKIYKLRFADSDSGASPAMPEQFLVTTGDGIPLEPLQPSLVAAEHACRELGQGERENKMEPSELPSGADPAAALYRLPGAGFILVVPGGEPRFFENEESMRAHFATSAAAGRGQGSRPGDASEPSPGLTPGTVAQRGRQRPGRRR